MPALPASATSARIDAELNAERSSWPAQRAGSFGGGPAGFEPEPRGSQPRMLPLHHDHHAADAGFAGVGHFGSDRHRSRTPGNHHGPRSGPDFPAESGDDRTRTGAYSPDKRVLLPLSYVPVVARVGFEPTVSSS